MTARKQNIKAQHVYMAALRLALWILGCKLRQIGPESSEDGCILHACFIDTQLKCSTHSFFVRLHSVKL